MFTVVEYDLSLDLLHYQRRNIPLGHSLMVMVAVRTSSVKLADTVHYPIDGIVLDGTQSFLERGNWDVREVTLQAEVCRK